MDNILTITKDVKRFLIIATLSMIKSLHNLKKNLYFFMHIESELTGVKMKIEHLIKNDNIYFIDKSIKDEVINDLIDKAVNYNYVKDREKFTEAIFERENIVGTGIGFGIAIPHVKLPCIDKFFILVGVLKNPVDWQSIDNNPVKIAFMIGGPDNDQKKYLQILSGLTMFLKEESRREKLFSINDKKEIKTLFHDF